MDPNPIGAGPAPSTTVKAVADALAAILLRGECVSMQEFAWQREVHPTTAGKAMQYLINRGAQISFDGRDRCWLPAAVDMSNVDGTTYGEMKKAGFIPQDEETILDLVLGTRSHRSAKPSRSEDAGGVGAVMRRLLR